jgi:hypothetical protein
MHMATAVSGVPPVSTRPTILERLSVPPQLAWGYLGLLLFMIGDGIEAGYLAPFLNGIGVSHGKIALMIIANSPLFAISAAYRGLVVDSRITRVHLSCSCTRARGLPRNFFKRVDHAVSAIP